MRNDCGNAEANAKKVHKRAKERPGWIGLVTDGRVPSEKRFPDIRVGVASLALGTLYRAVGARHVHVTAGGLDGGVRFSQSHMNPMTCPEPTATWSLGPDFRWLHRNAEHLFLSYRLSCPFPRSPENFSAHWQHPPFVNAIATRPARCNVATPRQGTEDKDRLTEVMETVREGELPRRRTDCVCT
jgi:hypothetical protein